MFEGVFSQGEEVLLSLVPDVFKISCSDKVLCLHSFQKPCPADSHFFLAAEPSKHCSK